MRQKPVEFDTHPQLKNRSNLPTLLFFSHNADKTCVSFVSEHLIELFNLGYRHIITTFNEKETASDSNKEYIQLLFNRRKMTEEALSGKMTAEEAMMIKNTLEVLDEDIKFALAADKLCMNIDGGTPGQASTLGYYTQCGFDPQSASFRALKKQFSGKEHLIPAIIKQQLMATTQLPKLLEEHLSKKIMKAEYDKPGGVIAILGYGCNYVQQQLRDSQKTSSALALIHGAKPAPVHHLSYFIYGTHRGSEDLSYAQLTGDEVDFALIRQENFCLGLSRKNLTTENTTAFFKTLLAEIQTYTTLTPYIDDRIEPNKLFASAEKSFKSARDSIDSRNNYKISFVFASSVANECEHLGNNYRFLRSQALMLAGQASEELGDPKFAFDLYRQARNLRCTLYSNDHDSVKEVDSLIKHCLIKIKAAQLSATPSEACDNNTTPTL
jgi:hypothetical protein